MKSIFYSTLIIIINIVIIGYTSRTSEVKVKSIYWPSKNWQISDPEEHGVNPRQIQNLIAQISIKGNLLIVRHGYIIAEYYKNENKRYFSPNIYSCTKGIVSALIGHAIDRGFIKSVHQSIFDYFRHYDLSTSDIRKRDITIYHLLTMSSGLQGTEGYTEFTQIYIQSDWSKFILDKKMVANPGTVFNYNSVNSHLLSTILQKATNLTAHEYAQHNLFGPLGITIKSWEQTPKKESIGGWGIRMSLGDMAKFGYLYLRKGRWDDKQIIPSNWIKESTKIHMNQSGDWSGWGYGYNWSIVPNMPEYTFTLVGGSGQYSCIITVIPKLDIVSVYAGPLHHNRIFELYRKYLYSAVNHVN